MNPQVLDQGFVERVYESIAESVVLVKPVGVRNVTSLGTGYVVRASDGCVDVVTCAHVALPGHKLNVTWNNVSYPAKVLERSKVADIALLRASIEGPIAPIPIRERRAKLGEFAVAFGFSGWGERLTLGIVSTVSDHYVVVDNRGAPGMSGGPLLDTNGQIIGTLSMADGGGFSVYVPSSQILDLLSQNKSIDDDVIDEFRVVLYNDPFNTRQRVESVLMSVANLAKPDAKNAMAAAHVNGTGLVASFDTASPATDLCVQLRAADLLVDVVPADSSAPFDDVPYRLFPPLR